MKDNLILMLKVLGFACLTTILHSSAIYSKESGEDLMYSMFTLANSLVLVTTGMKAFDKK